MMRWFFLTVSLISAVGSVVVFWVGGLLVLRESGFTIGTIVAFTAYLGMLYGPLSALTNARMDLATSLVSFERVFEVLDLPVEIDERPDALTLNTVHGHVRFSDVSFRYQADESEAEAAGLSEVTRFAPHGGGIAPPLSQEGGKIRVAGSRSKVSGDREPSSLQPSTDRWALRDVTFEVQPGQLAALVGPSGAGKTTVTYLLPRLYDPTEGAITIDGRDLRDLTVETLAAQIGHGDPGNLPVQRYHPGQPALCAARRNRSGDGGRMPRSEHPRRSSPTCPRATTPWWATAAIGSQAARSSAWPSLASF